MKIGFLLAMIAMASECSYVWAFDTFDAESKRVSSKIGCNKAKIAGAGSGYGRLYSCIGGTAETVKFFINEEPGSNKVKNVKFMWNDYSKDIGYGQHADKHIARAWASAMATMYAPKQVEEVVRVFSAKKNSTVVSDRYLLKYTYSVGPAIDERMFVVTLR